jgi:hypothetical protein
MVLRSKMDLKIRGLYGFENGNYPVMVVVVKNMEVHPPKTQLSPARERFKLMSSFAVKNIECFF